MQIISTFLGISKPSFALGQDICVQIGDSRDLSFEISDDRDLSLEINNSDPDMSFEIGNNRESFVSTCRDDSGIEICNRSEIEVCSSSSKEVCSSSSKEVCSSSGVESSSFCPISKHFESDNFIENEEGWYTL